MPPKDSYDPSKMHVDYFRTFFTPFPLSVVQFKGKLLNEILSDIILFFHCYFYFWLPHPYPHGLRITSYVMRRKSGSKNCDQIEVELKSNHVVL